MRRLALSAATFASAALLAACGSSSALIPSSYAGTIQTALAKISTDLYQADCTAAAADVASAQSDLTTLPTTVDARLGRNLSDGLTTLAGLVHDHCQSSTGNSGTTGQTGTTGTTGTTSATGTTGTTGTTSSTSTTGTTGTTGTTTTTSTSSTTSTATTSTAATGSATTTSGPGNGGTPGNDNGNGNGKGNDGNGLGNGGVPSEGNP